MDNHTAPNTTRVTSVSHAKNRGGKRVILVTYPDEFAKEEAIGLVEAAGYQIVAVMSQKKLFHPQYGVGAGKAEELRSISEEKKAQKIIVDVRISS